MNFINSIFSWLNIISFIILIDGILIVTGKHAPIHAKKKLEGKVLKSWRNTRFLALIIQAIGFCSFTFSESLSIDVRIKVVINLVGIALIFIGLTIIIRNNIVKIGKWSSNI